MVPSRSLALYWLAGVVVIAHRTAPLTTVMITLHASNSYREWLNDCQPGEARLLILDAYHSYITLVFMWRYLQNQIHPIWLPQHTSHVL
ncbi:transposase [Colletotrichum incanum]|nr:transposase [Colletotrichum incanum]